MKKRIIQLTIMLSKHVLWLLISYYALFSVAVANEGKGQHARNINDVLVEVEFKNSKIIDVFENVESQTEYDFVFHEKDIDPNVKIDLQKQELSLAKLLYEVSRISSLKFKQVDNNISVYPQAIIENTFIPLNTLAIQDITIKGKVTDTEGTPLPGVNIVEVGTTNGAVTNLEGNYTITVSTEDAMLSFSYIGYLTEEIPINGQTLINITLVEDIQLLDEVVVVGYGTMKKSDLTGSVTRADVEAFREQPNVSIVQSLQGSVSGLNVGQIEEAGEEPEITIRGRTSISGEQSPLVVLDGVIFRGNLIDINPNDIESVDILKDASSTAIYGSQAANGVILIKTKAGEAKQGKVVVNYSGYYAYQTPGKELKPGNGADYINQIWDGDILMSRTESSGYLERDLTYDETARFKSNQVLLDYQAGKETNWYDLVTNDNMHTQNHNISLSSNAENVNYYISLGHTEQVGYMLNEDYKRWNARINVDNKVTDWLKIGLQSFLTSSDYSGVNIDEYARFIIPYGNAYDENGEYITYPGGGWIINPLLVAETDHLDKRMNAFGNIYANIDFPFVKGLSYRVNYSMNAKNDRDYRFWHYEENLQGRGRKAYGNQTDWSVDNIITYKRILNEDHNLNITLVYGIEKRKYDYTNAQASVFTNDELGYNMLEAGSSELQSASSAAWEESSLYNMGRLFYGFRNKYLLTATIRRDGFSGFSEDNKFGIFPSASVAWVASEEPFIGNNLSWLNHLKVRLSYGSNGNRTIARYETLAKVGGGYRYITSEGTPVYGQFVNKMANPALKWETTTGFNIGLDFGILSNRITGNVDYYDNNTTNLLYNVDIPGITSYDEYTTNLGKLHNHGLEVSLSSVNIRSNDFAWITTVGFSRSRNELKELLGFDNDGDGKEDDLKESNLFIGKPLNSIYALQRTGGLYQLGDEIPTGFDLGAYRIVDANNDGEINLDDRKIIGYSDPGYRFSINNEVSYKNWTFRMFIYSVQGGKDHYYGNGDMYNFNDGDNLFQWNFPKDLDYWLPERPDAKFQRLYINVSSGQRAVYYAQRNFIRLQDISLSYTLPESMLKKVFIQNVKIFASAKNLLTITKWPGWDPETYDPTNHYDESSEKVAVGITLAGRPIIKSYTIGINVEF